MAECEVGCAAVIGTGVIGASWAACFLAAGLDVRAWDPAEGAESRCRAAVDACWPALEALGLIAGADRARLRFCPSMEEAVAGAEFVQESGPERLPLKQALFRQLDAAAAPGVPLASSSSTLMPSEYQAGCAHPARILLGHPFNPPHLIPLVEVVGGAQTGEAALAAAERFYAAVGKRPVRLRREMRGHVANRLQAALWQEAIHLVREGVVDVAGLDAVLSHGPGLRWALLGAFFNLHLSGGPGGMRHALDHLGPAIEAMWRDLGRAEMDAEVRQLIAGGTEAALAPLDVAETVRRRDEVLIRLLRLKAEAALP